MPPATVAALIAAAERHWGFADGIEITLEANPSSVEAARFADLAAAGINRVSLGLQALDDEALRFLGRAHDAAEGVAALHVAQSAFARVSFDLIYARPGQSPESWAAELGRALALGTGHLSLYQLTVEPGTRFATLLAQGTLTELDPTPPPTCSRRLAPAPRPQGSPPMRSPTTRARARRAATTSPTGGTRIISASAPARMAAAPATRPCVTRSLRTGSGESARRATASRSRTASPPPTARPRRC
jgi:hypothetical protein